MTFAAYITSMTIENIVLAGGILSLLLIVAGLHARNLRWLRLMASSEATTAAQVRLEKLIASVEMLTKTPKNSVKYARPLNKGPKFVPAGRCNKAIPARRQSR